MSGYLKPHPWDRWGSPDSPGDPILAERRQLDAWLDDFLRLSERLEEMEEEKTDLDSAIRKNEALAEELYTKLVAARPDWQAPLEDGLDPRLGDG